ncbi:MAG: hypothetical protein QM813_03725 [Verrucomicrobiota bacterium]
MEVQQVELFKRGFMQWLVGRVTPCAPLVAVRKDRRARSDAPYLKSPMVVAAPLAASNHHAFPDTGRDNPDALRDIPWRYFGFSATDWSVPDKDYPKPRRRLSQSVALFSK